MIAKDVLSRVLWEVDDEFLDIVTKPELIKALDYVYHEFCLKTRVLAKQIGFVATGTNEYDLYGTTAGGVLFGDNVTQFYRIEVGGLYRGVESTFEDVMNARLYNTYSYGDNQLVYYSIKYYEKYMRIYFPYNVPDGTEVVLWYYETPRIGTISTESSEFSIDDKYVISLIAGLKMVAYRRMIHRMFRKENQDKFSDDMRKLYGSFYSEAKSEWNEEMKRIERDAQAYKEQITPIVQEIASPMSVDFSDDSITTSWQWD